MALTLHPGALLVTPYQQGRLDALCGLYALINALRVLHAPHRSLPTRLCKDLFAAGMEALNAKPSSRVAVHSGMTVARQRKLARAILKSAILRPLPKIVLRAPLPKASTMEALDRSLQAAIASGDVLLACFHGRLSHHSVIVGISPARILLCDSDGLRYVLKASIRLPNRQCGSLVLRSLFPIGPAGEIATDGRIL